MSKKAKLIIYIIAAVLLVAIATVGTIITLKSSQTSTNSAQQPSKETADTIKLDAIKISASDPSKAKTLYEQALKEYQSLGDTHNANDVAMQLKILEYQAKQK